MAGVFSKGRGRLRPIGPILGRLSRAETAGNFRSRRQALLCLWTPAKLRLTRRHHGRFRKLLHRGRVLVDGCEVCPSKGHAVGHVAGLPRKRSWQGRGQSGGAYSTVPAVSWPNLTAALRNPLCSAAIFLQGGRDVPCQISALWRNNNKRCRHRCKPGK